MRYLARIPDDVIFWLRLVAPEIRTMLGGEIKRLQANPFRANVSHRFIGRQNEYVFRVGYYGIAFRVDIIDDVVVVDAIYRVDTYRRRRRNPR